MATDSPLPTDCRECGACCFSRLPTYVRVTGRDWTRLGPEAEHRAHFIGHRAYMKMNSGHCAALDVHPGPNGGLVFVCSVYERRPEVCRSLERGSPQCEAERIVKRHRASGIAQI